MKTHEYTGAGIHSVTSQRWLSVMAAVVVVVAATPVSAQERLCDNAFEDCRTPIVELIRAEKVGIDVSFWFMTDTRYSSEIIARWRAGVPVRVLLDQRADTNYPANASVRQSFVAAGIPVRHKTTTGINHWKMMLYAGQNTIHFSAANFANGSYSPVVPYINYVDEAIYFTNDQTVVQTFMRKFDDLWTDTAHFQNLANVSGPLTRRYPAFALDAALNFPPDQDYQDRLIAQMRQETQQIDVSMFRITSAKVPDEMIRRHQAGVTVRLITDIGQYRNTTYFWHSYNVDRMYMAGIPIKRKRHDSLTDQDMHQKSAILYGRDMAVFGSSNWTASSSDTQREHNYFTTKTWIVDWFKAQFERKWNNRTATDAALAQTMYFDFSPGWPETPVNVTPSNGATGIAAPVVLRWEGGWWAHKYDIYFGTVNPPPLVAEDFMPGSATAGVSSTKESFNPCLPPAPFVSICPAGLAGGTTYYWMVRGKTMVGNARAVSGRIWSFTTAGTSPPPRPTGPQVTADAYVRSGPYATSNFGTAGELIAKGGADPQYQREAYMQFNIGDVQAGSTVRLRLAGRLSDTRTPSVTAEIYPVTSTTWTEPGITWNTKPAAEPTALGHVTVSGTSTRWYDVDLTTFVQTQRTAGRTAVAVVLKASEDTLSYVSFGSRESAMAPLLIVTSAPPQQAGRVLSDAYVRAGQYAGTNYGTATDLVVKFSTDTQYVRETYLIFDVSIISPGQTASVRLNGRLSDARQATVNAQIFAVANTTWLENSLTWDTRPASGALLGSLAITGTSLGSYTLDVTSYVLAERNAGRTRIAIAIKSPADALPYIAFSSRESANSPALLIR